MVMRPFATTESAPAASPITTAAAHPVCALKPMARRGFIAALLLRLQFRAQGGCHPARERAAPLFRTRVDDAHRDHRSGRVLVGSHVGRAADFLAVDEDAGVV